MSNQILDKKMMIIDDPKPEARAVTGTDANLIIAGYPVILGESLPDDDPVKFGEYKKTIDLRFEGKATDSEPFIKTINIEEKAIDAEEFLNDLNAMLADLQLVEDAREWRRSYKALIARLEMHGFKIINPVMESPARLIDCEGG